MWRGQISEFCNKFPGNSTANISFCEGYSLFRQKSKLSRRTHGIELGPVLMERYDRVAIKNGQEHCLTSSERGDRSIQSGRC